VLWLTMLLLTPAMLDIPPTPPAVSSPAPTRVWVTPKPTPGRHVPLSVGTLYIPAGLDRSAPVPVVIHFHGSAWLPDVAATQTGHKFALVNIDIGVNSDAYQARFANPNAFRKLMDEVRRQLKVPVGPVTLSGFSAGYGAVREILKNKANWDDIDTVILVDGMHAAYRSGAHGATVQASDVAPFVEFARLAAAGQKRMLITHSAVYPGAFASTTETADFLLSCLNLTRTASRQPGPFRSMMQLSEAHQGQFRLLGFAGNDSPDHYDQLQALATWWKMAQVWEPQRSVEADE